jgi:hypothetical protein
MTVIIVAAVLLVILDLVALRRSLRATRHGPGPRPPEWSVRNLPSEPYVLHR